MDRAPALSVVAAFLADDRLMPRVLDAAAAEAALLLSVPIEPRLALGRGPARALRHGLSTAPADLAPLEDARLFRATFAPGALRDALVALAPHALRETTVLVTDAVLEPPPGWRYLVFKRFSARLALVSLAPLDPRFWDEEAPERPRLLKTRLRAALLATFGATAGTRLPAPRLRLAPCDEPGCFLQRGVDGLDALDAMTGLGRAHAPHPSAGRRFRPASRPLDLDALEAAPPPPPPHPPAFERAPRRRAVIDPHWAAGPSASLEIFHARRLPSGGVAFDRRHTSPWASTVRPPVDAVVLPRAALARVHAALRRALRAAGVARGVNLPLPPELLPAVPPSPPLDALRRAGRGLYDALFPVALERDLPAEGAFLGIGVDELLLDEPFELLHDHAGFLALRHHVGRFVNVQAARPAAHPPVEPPAAGSGPLRALVVGASRTRVRGALPLPHAEEEAEAVSRTLARLGARVTVLAGAAATTTALEEALRARPHLVHYAGHARGARRTSAGPRPARLLLADGALDASWLGLVAARRPPTFVALNACDAARTDALGDAGADLQGLVDALLLAGSYVLAPRWPVTDAGAHRFAEAFYAALLDESQPLGAAVTRARLATRKATPPADLTWAGYVLYGDPRLALGRPRS